MRIPCPICGARDAREFTYRGFGAAVHRPQPDAGEEAWDDYLHLRDNQPGRVKDLWYHRAGCGAWLVVDRDTVSHEVFGAVLAEDAQTKDTDDAA